MTTIHNVTEEQADEAIGRLLSYAWSDEMSDYCEQRDNGDIEPNDENHIFTHMVRLDRYVSNGIGTAEDLYRTERE